MGFVYPYFLFGLFAIAIPIVIHLFNFRRFKKVYFTNVRLLKDLEIESRKQNKVKNRLLLLLRCLSVIFLVLLFAGPYIKNEDKALVKQGRKVWFLGSFVSREDIVEEWKRQGLKVTETGSYLLERYWFNLYLVEE